MIHIQNLSKSYGNKKALDNLTLTINKGVFGLLGENGAGKSTLMNILATLKTFDSGNVSVMGYDVLKNEEEVRKVLGYLPQRFDFFPNISVYEAMDYLASLKKISKNNNSRNKEIHYLLERVNLIDSKHKRIKQLSGGMKQRLGIAQSLLGNPQIIILDEPTVGLDPKERLSFRNLINELSQEKIIILSTHIITDISSSCENLAIVKNGRLLYSGTVVHLTEKLKGMVYTIEVDNKLVGEISDEVNIISVLRKQSAIEVRFIAENIEKKLCHAKMVEPTLEDAYFYTSFIDDNKGGSR